MGKFELYSIDLKNLTPGVHDYEYLLDNKFFADIEGDQVQRGKVHVTLTVKKMSMMFEMNFKLDGIAIVPCDRCLDDMEQSIETENRLIVKFGTEYAEEDDEIVIIPEDEGKINLAWFLYEFIVLAIPMKHVHAPGKCNRTMASKLRRHIARSTEDEDEGFLDSADEEEWEDEVSDNIDPRWAVLKGLVENNNN